MASFSLDYLYLVDQNGNSINGKVDELVQNSTGTATETGVGGTVGDGIASVGEQFDLVFNDSATNLQYGGTYTYIAHDLPFVGILLENASGDFFLFSDNVIPIRTKLNGFTPENTPELFPSHTVSVYADDTLTSLVATHDGATAFSDALAAAAAGQVIAVDHPATLGDVGAQSVTVDNLTIIADKPFDASLSLAGSAHILRLADDSDIDLHSSDIDVVGNATGGVLQGNDGANVLTGQGGPDQLDGGLGADTLTGGAGNDIYVVDNVGDQVIEAAGGGTDTVYSSINYTLGANVENLRANSDAGLVLTGNALDNYVVGRGGNDTLDGGLGNDTLDGQAGADIMTGGAGDDRYFVDNAGDQVIEAAGGGTDTVYASINYTLGANVENLRANSDSGLVLTGNALDNYLVGRGGNDTLDGGLGNDTLDGQAGADTMTGGAGDDRYFVDNAGDQVIESAGGGSDTVYTTIDYTLGANVENLRANSDSGLVLTGNALDNYVVGRGGNGTLDGKGGNDKLTGGGGNDTFVFDTPLVAGKVSTITDFAPGADKISLSSSVFSAAGAAGALSADAFVIGTAAQDASDRIIYNSATGALLYDADGTGAAAATQFARLTTGLGLTAGDFTIV